MEHTCNGKPRPTCPACWEDVETARERRDAEPAVIINAPNNRGVVIGRVENGMHQ